MTTFVGSYFAVDVVAALVDEEIMAGSISIVLGFSTILKSLMCSILNVTSLISVSVGGTSFAPFLRPSDPKDLTPTRVMDLFTGSTALRMPSYRICTVVMMESLEPKSCWDCRPPPEEGCGCGTCP